MQSSDVFLSPRPSTSNPKLRHFTTSPVVYNANAKDHEEHITPRNTSSAAGCTTSATCSSGGFGVGVGAKMVELDPAILWSTEADVPMSMLARPSTSNPRYVEALLSSQNPSNAVSPTAANIAALYGSQMHLKQQTSPHQHQTLNSSDRQSPTATITSENTSNVHENTVAAATANDGSPHPASSTTSHHHHHQNPHTHFWSVTPRTHAEPSAPVLWSDGVGGVDTKLLARPVTANPWLQRVFDSVDISPQVDQTAEDDEDKVDEDEDYTTMVGGGEEADATDQISNEIPSNTIDDAISLGFEGKKLGSSGHRGNFHSKNTSGAYKYNNPNATRRPVDLDPVGSYTIWSREEPRPYDAMTNVDVREEGKDHVITELKKIIVHQQIEMATMRARIEALESLCTQANLITSNRDVPPSQQGGFVSYALPQTQESYLYQQPHPPAPAPGPSSRRASQKRASPLERQRDAEDVGQGRVSSIGSLERPSSAVPNDPALAEAIRKSTSRFEKGPSSSIPTVISVGAQTPPPAADALTTFASEIARELANAIHVDTPPPKMQKASDVSSNATSTTTAIAVHHAIVDDDDAMVTEPPPDQSPISFGVPGGRGEESSPSPLLIDDAHKSLIDHSTTNENGNQSHPNCVQIQPRALLVDSEAECEESSGRKSREPSSFRVARPKTAIGHRRSSPPNNDAAQTCSAVSAHPTTHHHHHEEMPPVVYQKDGVSEPDGGGDTALLKLKLADDDDDEAPFETFDVDVEEAKDRKKCHANEALQKKKEENVLSAVSIFRNEKEPREGRTTTTKSISSAGGGTASNGQEDDRPRSAHRVIPPNPPSTASGKSPQILADNLLCRPSSRADSDIYIREDKGELSNEEEVERSFSKGYHRSPNVHNRNPGAPTSNTLAYRSVQFGLVPTTHSGAFNTGLSFPPRPESALPSRRAARLRNAVGQCRAVTSAPSRRGDNTKRNDLDVTILRPGTAQARPSRDAQSTTTAAHEQVLSVPPRRCASAGLSRPFLDTTTRHLGPTDKFTYGRQRDLDIRKEYANILRKGEHAVTKDDFKSLYMERASEYGMMPSDEEVEDLMAPFCKEGADHLSVDEFGVLFLKMSAW